LVLCWQVLRFRDFLLVEQIILFFSSHSTEK
jgi:hypothetical protein